MLKINVPDVAWSEQSISLDGKEYRFVMYFNQRDERWRMDIYYGSNVVLTGIKIIENQFLVSLPFAPRYFQHGDIFCVRIKNDGKPAGRNNLGFGKAYELIYLTNEEIVEIMEEQ